MAFEAERDALIQQIEAAFAEQLSGDALTTFLQVIVLSDSPYYPDESQH